MTHRVAALVALACLALAVPMAVSAHAGLVSSEPADGETIDTPNTLTAVFEEEIDPELSTLTVENAAGEIVSSGVVDADDGTRMTAELPALPDGVYTVRWTTVTPDDTGIERGTFTFNVGSAQTSATPAPSQIPIDGPGSGEDLAALLLAAVLIGAVVVIVIIRGRR